MAESQTTHAWSDWDAERWGFECDPGCGLTVNDDVKEPATAAAGFAGWIPSPFTNGLVRRSRSISNMAESHTTRKPGRWAVIRIPTWRPKHREVNSTWTHEGDAIAEAMHLNLHTKRGTHLVEYQEQTS